MLIFSCFLNAIKIKSNNWKDPSCNKKWYCEIFLWQTGNLFLVCSIGSQSFIYILPVIDILHNFSCKHHAYFLTLWSKNKVQYVLYFFLRWRIDVIWSWLKGRLLITTKECALSFIFSNGSKCIQIHYVFSQSLNVYHWG